MTLAPLVSAPLFQVGCRAALCKLGHVGCLYKRVEGMGLRDALGLGAQRACFTQARLCALGTRGLSSCVCNFRGKRGMLGSKCCIWACCWLVCMLWCPLQCWGAVGGGGALGTDPVQQSCVAPADSLPLLVVSLCNRPRTAPGPSCVVGGRRWCIRIELQGCHTTDYLFLGYVLQHLAAVGRLGSVLQHLAAVGATRKDTLVCSGLGPAAPRRCRHGRLTLHGAGTNNSFACGHWSAGCSLSAP